MVTFNNIRINNKENTKKEKKLFINDSNKDEQKHEKQKTAM